MYFDFAIHVADDDDALVGSQVGIIRRCVTQAAFQPCRNYIYICEHVMIGVCACVSVCMYACMYLWCARGCHVVALYNLHV